jgi:hypothetical protein
MLFEFIIINHLKLKQMKKTLFNFMAILAVTLITVTILVGTCFGQEPDNYLKVKGEIFNNYNATITVYVEAEGTFNEWSKVASKTVSKRYRLRIATDKSYQVFFMSDAGHTKVIHITRGEPGTYLEYIDIDFEGSPEKHACMYQNDDGYYTFQTKGEFHSRASLE